MICTHWRCTCGAKLHYRNRFIEAAGSLVRYYTCKGCDRIWRSEERLQSFKHRDG